MSDDDMKAELERLRRENEELKAKKKGGALELKVSQKGAVSLYGLRRFPVTFYTDEWTRILDMGDEIRAFLREHDAELKKKG